MSSDQITMKEFIDLFADEKKQKRKKDFGNNPFLSGRR